MKIELAYGETVSNWLPTEEYAPTDGEIVLITIEHLCGFDNVIKDIAIARCVMQGDGYKVILGRDEGGDVIPTPSHAMFQHKRVTAWAHLPDIYSGDGDN